ncbi:protein containing DUF62 [Candidatus Magnetomorum sp. HK-1]|nr:protein containing DUF62 [Candidatus Magnetomorum sp. HK-1]
MKPSCISLMTDFGLSDEYVGVMKGVIASINPYAQVIDITHQIMPQNILQAAYTLWFSYAYFPKNTLHVVVVDPGVGSDRQIIALKASDYFFLAPDNGILSFILNKFQCSAVRIDRSEFFLPNVSDTFHGRDIFAPVAAHISKNQNIENFGSIISSKSLTTLSNTGPYVKNKQVIGKVIMSDRFGNLITNISVKDMNQISSKDDITIQIRDTKIMGISCHYEQVKKNTLLAIIGSKGLLEISVNCGNAKHELGVEIGCQICIK